MVRPGRFFMIGLCLGVLVCSVRAEKPVLEDLSLAGAGRGSTNLITLSGKFEPWPPKLWIEGVGIEHSFETNKGKMRLVISPEAETGPRLLRIYNEEGASEPRIFVVGEENEILEAEPNDHFLKPQTVEQSPATINGRLEKRGDVDSYLIPVQSGEWLDARLENYVLMGKMDGVLRLVNEQGQQLSWNHDGGTLDPRLIWRAATEQKVVLQVFGFAYPANAQIQLAGGEGGSYRLQIEKRTQPPRLVSGGGACETEPNNEPAQAQLISVPSAVEGKIERGLDEDRFSFQAEKDRFYLIDLQAAELGSPLDAWLRIEDGDGKELAKNDDAEGTSDPKLEWKAPENGKFVLAIGSVTHRGGEDYQYELKLNTGEPDYRLTLENSSVLARAGETNEVKLKAAFLRGFTNVLEAWCEQLPQGITSEPATITAAGDVTLKLIAASDAPSANAPFRVVVRDTVTDQKRSAQMEFTSRSVNNGVPGGYQKLLVETTEELWLTVAPKPPEKTEEKAAKEAGPQQLRN